jgi:uncharacterized membrane protein YdbT with pleckstrin-like domain
MANTYLDNMLGESERILLIARQHWFRLLSTIFLEIILILAIVGGTTVLLVKDQGSQPYAALIYLLVLLPLTTMTRDILVWANREYIITNRRVMQISGVFSKTVTDSSLEKVNDVKMHQSTLGRLFDYGDIEILTASELGVNLFQRISEPVKFKTAMLNAKERLSSAEVYPVRQADIPAQIAGLDQLRKQGVLTEEEFQQKKTELLARM